MITNLERLYLLKIPEVRKMFIEAMEKVVDRASIDEMVKAIENNDMEALYIASGFTESVLNPFIDKLEEVYEKAGGITISSWPKKLRADFNIRNKYVSEDILNYSSELISNITDEVKEVIRYVVNEGYQRGLNPRVTALELVGRINPITRKREGGRLGLSKNQNEWVNNCRKYLENLDKRYLNLGLRDRNFDVIFEKALEENKPITKENIEKMIMAYNNKAFKYRGDAIARTETMHSINRAEYMSIKQNIDEGRINENQVTKWWSDTHDSRTRHTHIQLGKEYNRKNAIPFNEPFVSVSGDKLMFPGDQSLGANPKEIIHCRCKAEYFIDFLAEFV